MKKDKLIFWITTSIISLMMLFSAFNYLTNDEMKAAFTHLGFPSYFRVELAIAKILAAFAIIIPAIPKQLKEFSYFGLSISFISAAIAHGASGDGVAAVVTPIVVLIILGVSYFYSQKSYAK